MCPLARDRLQLSGLHTRNFMKANLPRDVSESILGTVSGENVQGFKESPLLKNSQSPLLKMGMYKRNKITGAESEDGGAGPG